MGLAALKISDRCAYPFPINHPATRATDKRLFSPTAADCRVSENGGCCGEVRLEGSWGRGVTPGGNWNAAHDRGSAFGSEEGQRISKGDGPGWRNHRKCTRNRLKTLKRTRE